MKDNETSHICTNMYINIHTYVQICTYTYTHAYVQICTYTYTCICTYLQYHNYLFSHCLNFTFLLSYSPCSPISPHSSHSFSFTLLPPPFYMSFSSLYLSPSTPYLLSSPLSSSLPSLLSSFSLPSSFSPSLPLLP